MKYNGILYGVIGILIAVFFVFYGLRVGSYLGDKIAEIRGVGYESYTAGITNLLFMILLLLASYLIFKKLIRNNTLGKFFLWTVVVLDGLYILLLLTYLLL